MVTLSIKPSYTLYYVAPADFPKGTWFPPAAVLYPGYRPLFYQTHGLSSWGQLHRHVEKEGLFFYELGSPAALTWQEFEAKLLRPNSSPLLRDPLEERKLEGWYDDEGYAFCHPEKDNHEAPIHKLSATERSARAYEDLRLVKAHQAERTLRRAASLSLLSDRRKRSGRRTASETVVTTATTPTDTPTDTET